MLTKHLKTIINSGNSISLIRFFNPKKPICQVNPIHVVAKRDASIHTRHILIQKAKLEHISNFGIVLLAFPLATFGLGIWQIKRKIWKEQLIANLKHQMSKEPLELLDNLTQLDNMEYQPVTVSGHFIHEKELYLGPRSLIESEENKRKGGVFTLAPKTGYLVITPFQLEGRDEVILINRGWVPKNKKNPQSRSDGQIEAQVQITGIVRKQENRPQFVPKMGDGKIFLYRDINRMTNITGAEPYYLDATAASSVPGGPIGGQTTVSIRNEHMTYVATWFTLSGLSLFFWHRLVYLIPK